MPPLVRPRRFAPSPVCLVPKTAVGFGDAGRVDHANHAGNLYRTLTDGVAFNDAIRTAIEMTTRKRH